MFRNNDITPCKELTEDMLIKYIEEICNKPTSKQPFIIISNSLTDEQINQIIKSRHGFR